MWILEHSSKVFFSLATKLAPGGGGGKLCGFGEYDRKAGMRGKYLFSLFLSFRLCELGRLFLIGSHPGNLTQSKPEYQSNRAGRSRPVTFLVGSSG